MTEDEALHEINAWLRSRPGLFGPHRDAGTVWREALRRSQVNCAINFFQWHLRRAGFEISIQNGGAVLDLSNVEVLGLEG